MRIGVTGASGFIGQALVPALLHAGHEVRILARAPEGVSVHAWADRVDCVQGALEQAEVLQEFCEGCGAVIHLAALAHSSGTTDSEHTRVTVAGTAGLLAAMQQAGVSTLVFISSIKASTGSAASHYGRAKAQAEQGVKEASGTWLNAVILRPAIVYGPGMKGSLATWIRRLRKGWMPRLPAGTASLRMVSRRDLCRAVVASLDLADRQAPVFEVNDGRQYPLHKLELVLRKVLNRPLPVVVFPGFVWWLAAWTSECVFTLTGRSTGLTMQTWQTLFRDDGMSAERFPGLDPCETLESALPGIIRALE